ncbi:FAD-dependent monooxygenase [Streptomyces coeruleorubidus]|uniref:FAD-dependent monooxygenase n=1 Tax=Streptomyces coeruleorubidus TaxID=116188 RepID=UPI00237F2A16|nr:FAD-dependent monooxygenase [Streptomyces coeruleorubidus]WDV51785.1 FAD-dependent monooxygenase [Streptomyces coeruleorubidus]
MTAGDADVLIVGGGPTGLLAACELLRRGVRVRIVDRAMEPTNVPKALSLWPRVRDILTDLGVGEEVRRLSVPVHAFRYFSDRRPVASLTFTEDLAARQLPQYETERILTERLHALGGKVERGVRLLCLDGVDFSGRIEPGGTVTAVLEHGDGAVERFRVPFVIGADGAGSAVRGQLGIGFEGTTYEMAFALIDTHIDGHLPPDEIAYYQTLSGTLVVVPQPDGVFRFLSLMPGGGTLSREGMQEIIDTYGPRGVRITQPVWETVFRVHARRAGEFRRGRVFLAGDAAHIHSPAGGQGMNNGLQDAQNIAWKLAAVLQGRSPVSLLDTYGTERTEVTRRIVRDTDLHTRALTARTPRRAAVRDTAFTLLDRSSAAARLYAPVMAGRRLAYAPERDTQHPSSRRCRMRGRLPGAPGPGAVFPREAALALGTAGPDADPTAWTLLLRPPAEDARWVTETGHIAARWPQLRVLWRGSGAAERQGICRRPGYYLIRPDGHIAAHGHAGDLDRLEAELGFQLIPGAR